MKQSQRFVISRNGGDVSILDTGHDLVQEEGNAELLYIGFENEAHAKMFEVQLDCIVRVLNEQDKELKEMED